MRKQLNPGKNIPETVRTRNSTHEGAAVEARMLPEAGQQEGVRRSGLALTLNDYNAELLP